MYDYACAELEFLTERNTAEQTNIPLRNRNSIQFSNGFKMYNTNILLQHWPVSIFNLITDSQVVDCVPMISFIEGCHLSLWVGV